MVTPSSSSSQDNDGSKYVGVSSPSHGRAPSPSVSILKPTDEYKRRTINIGPSGSDARLSLLLKNKDLLEKEIMKERREKQKDLSNDVQEELSAEIVSRIRAEEVKGKERRTKGEEENKNDNKDSTTRANKKPAKKEKLLCICRAPYDNTKFYVGCEHCSNWFHGECVGVTEEMSETMEEFECPDCQREDDPKELYCICKQPYDKSQFYVGCEYCSNWFHGDCVGVTEEMCKTMEEYVCAECRRAIDSPSPGEDGDSDTKP